jgi:hypothetical protein
MAFSLAHNGTRVDGMARKLDRYSRMDDSPRNIKLVSNRWRRRNDRAVVASEVADLPQNGEDAAAQVAELRAELEAEDAGFDWGYEEWKLERAFRAAELEFDSAMTRMDDDGAPIWRDHWAW